MKIYIFVIFILTIIVFSGCSKTKLDVQLTYDVVKTNGRKFKIAGKTNLPNETKLYFSVRTTKTRAYTKDGLTGVQNGHFETPEFSSNDADLPSGEYYIVVRTESPKYQPESVRRIIGENGEELKGSLAEVKEERNGNKETLIFAKKNFQLE
jgi:hypothetical protein